MLFFEGGFPHYIIDILIYLQNELEQIFTFSFSRKVTEYFAAVYFVAEFKKLKK